MSMGVGKRYWVHMIKHHCENLESVIKFMQENAPTSNLQWFELRALVNVKQGQITTCDEYQCDLVEEAK